MAQQQTSAAKLTTAEKRRQALQYKLAGFTYQQISDFIGCSKPMAYKYVRKALETIEADTREHAEQVRKIESARLERLLAAVWSKAMKGELGAVDRAQKLAERITRVEGAEHPSKVAPTTPDGEESAPGVVALPATADGAEAWTQAHQLQGPSGK